MGYRRLFIWVEGPDDVRFFNEIIKPIFDKRYDWVEVRAYAKQRSDYVIKFVKSIKAMKADYFFVADINSVPCITKRKQKLHKIFKNVDEDRILVIVQEIESWYLAGLDEASSEKLRLPIFKTTNSFTKERFDGLIPEKFDSRIDFMLEILKHFSLEIAKQKNDSLKYFIEKHQKEGGNL